MITVERALQLILDSTSALESVKIPLLNARGKVLAEDIVAEDDVPSFNYASTTGYAVRSADVARASFNNPVPIQLDGNLLPGQQWDQPLKSRHTIKINMGALLPNEADSVLPEEHAVRQTNKKLLIYRAARAGSNIRCKGEDIQKGTLVLLKCKRLNAADIGTLSALGFKEVKCFRTPQVSFLTSGSGLTDDNGLVPDSRIRLANRYTFYSQLYDYGAEPVDLGVTDHNCAEIKEKVTEGFKYDMFVSMVGHSYEDFSFMKKMLEQLGMDTKFWKVAVKPAAPIIFGIYNKKIPVFGLSGTPFAFYVMLEQFVRPVLMKMTGCEILKRTEIQAMLTKDIKSDGGVTSYMGGTYSWNENGFVIAPDFRKSSSIRALTSVNGLIVIPPNVGFLKAGSKVTVQVIDGPAAAFSCN
jgi:molybdopterin molybdotransferase